MAPLYANGVTPRDAVEGTLARWYVHYLKTNGHEPPEPVARVVRTRIEAIAQRRDRKWSRAMGR